MAKKGPYYIVGEGGNRISSDPGSATVIGGSRGGDKSVDREPIDWNHIAYTAGGGALGYFLSKWIMGDEDEENSGGKKKGKGILRSIVPWLAAAAGAYGGHLLSGSGLTDKGRNGEFAFKMNGDGTIRVPEKPPKGKSLHAAGTTAMAAGALPLGRGILSAAENRIPRNQARINALNARRIAINNELGGGGLSLARANALRAERAAIHEEIRGIGQRMQDIAARRSRHPYITGFIRRVGHQAPGAWGRLLNTRGSIATALMLEALGIGAHTLGHYRNKNLREWREALAGAGISTED